jgi:hypothetical protein
VRERSPNQKLKILPRLTLIGAVMSHTAVAETQLASAQIVQPGVMPQATPMAPSSSKSDWHFQVTYGVSSADVEAPYWNTNTDPAGAAQRSTTGALSQTRYSHSVESPINGSQAIRYGLSLVNDQTAAANSWLKSLAKESKSPDWRAWGLGSEIFLVRHISRSFDFDAGLQADYYLSGVATLGSVESSLANTTTLTRLDQKSGWRLAFTGGMNAGLFGPVGLIMRVSGYVMQSTFTGHSKPLRAQGLQLQLGADMALGRGEP